MIPVLQDDREFNLCHNFGFLSNFLQLPDIPDLHLNKLVTKASPAIRFYSHKRDVGSMLL